MIFFQALKNARSLSLLLMVPQKKLKGAKTAEKTAVLPNKNVYSSILFVNIFNVSGVKPATVAFGGGLPLF